MIKLNKEKNASLIGVVCAVLCEVIFGASFLFTKTATENNSVFSLLGWRFAVAFAVMCLLAALKIIKINLKGRAILRLLPLALCHPVLYFIGENFGIHYTTASESGIFIAVIPVTAMAASALILHKKPTKLQAAGIVVSLVGVVITVLSVGINASFSPLGYALLLLSVLSFSVFSALSERASGYTASEKTFVMLMSGTVVFVLAALTESFICGSTSELVTLPFHDTNFLFAVLFQGIGCSVIAFMCSNKAIANIGVTRTASFVGISTVVSIVLSALLLGEKLTVLQIVGAAVIMAGVYIANAVQKKKS